MLQGALDLKTPTYTINGTSQDWLYFLVDGIYPDWAIFVKTIPIGARQTEADDHYAAMQESVRKDVERAFGILVKKFHILARPIRRWYIEDIRTMLYTCIILHNMVIEERLNETGLEDAISAEEFHQQFTTTTLQEGAVREELLHMFHQQGDQHNQNADNYRDAMTRRFLEVQAFHSTMTNPNKSAQLRNDLKAYLMNRKQHRR